MAQGKRPDVTDEQKAEFVELAQEIGIAGAMRQLGYPASYATAHRWAEVLGTTIATDDVMRQAAILNLTYKDRDKLIGVQRLYERILERLNDPKQLAAEEVTKFANALQRIIQTMHLVEGKATDRREQWSGDNTHVAIMEELNQYMATQDTVEHESTRVHDDADKPA